MLKNITLSTNHTYHAIGGFCPRCHRYEPVGDVEVTAKIAFRPDASPENIHICHLSLMNMETDDYTRVKSFISIICPECGMPMIQIDDSLSFAITELNANAFFTRASCDGYESYSQAYIMLYDLPWLIELIDRTDMFSRYSFEYEGSPHTVFKYADGHHAMNMLLFDEKLHCIRPLTDQVAAYLCGLYDCDAWNDEICKDQEDFVNAVNEVCKELKEWKRQYAASDRTDKMSLVAYATSRKKKHIILG